MINIRYTAYGGEYILDVQGHAGYAESGKDIVCSAVSILIQACMQSINSMAEHIRTPTVTRGKGSAHIRFFGDNTADIFMATTVKGLKLLAENYPDNVKFVEVIL